MWSAAVLLIRDLLQPLDVLAVQGFLNRDVSHRRRVGCAVPMLFSRRAGDDIARVDLFFWLAPALRPAKTGDDYQCLAARVRMPCRTRAGLKADAGAAELRRSGCLEQRIDAHVAGKVLRRAFDGWLRAVSLDIQICPLVRQLPI